MRLSIFLRTVCSAFVGALAGAACVLYLLGAAPLGSRSVTEVAAQPRTFVSSFSDSSTITKVYYTDSPGVVSITSTSDPNASRFFTSPRPEQGAGSGFVVDEKGNIVTSDHVVAGASDLRVTFWDSVTLPARVVGEDPGDDLAVIRVDSTAHTLFPLAVGTSNDVLVGQPVIVIGNPFNYHNSVSQGIVSALSRSRPSLNGHLIVDMIQTDAMVNPGNSGGPLLDQNGQVVGVLSQIESPVRGSVGVSFAVPSSTLARVLPQLAAGQTVHQPWIGIDGEAVTPDLVARFHLPVSDGVYVDDASAGGPAAQAGIKGGAAGANHQATGTGDIITMVDGVAVHSPADLGAYVDTRAPTDRVTITYLRDGKSQTALVQLVPWPEQS
ncbi:MAG TPA: trypsin-like peptidase domain-containing protein [Chloroflexota bacterium]|nr:trypsin-like peptidase domain-containing protein [Chloroflexota bacterium]